MTISILIISTYNNDVTASPSVNTSSTVRRSYLSKTCVFDSGPSMDEPNVQQP